MTDRCFPQGLCWGPQARFQEAAAAAAATTAPAKRLHSQRQSKQQQQLVSNLERMPPCVALMGQAAVQLLQNLLAAVQGLRQQQVLLEQHL